MQQLDSSVYDLEPNQEVDTFGILNISNSTSTVSSLKETLEKIYCGSVGAEFSYVTTAEEKEWLIENYENLFNIKLEDTDRKEIAELMIKSQAWDNFLATKFPTVKRYGGEGNESFFAFFRQLFLSAVHVDLQGIVLGMPHRGRLNLLTILLGTRPVKIFHKYKGNPEFPSDVKAMCDIAQHFREYFFLIFF